LSLKFEGNGLPVGSRAEQTHNARVNALAAASTQQSPQPPPPQQHVSSPQYQTQAPAPHYQQPPQYQQQPIYQQPPVYQQQAIYQQPMQPMLQPMYQSPQPVYQSPTHMQQNVQFQQGQPEGVTFTPAPMVHHAVAPVPFQQPTAAPSTFAVGGSTASGNSAAKLATHGKWDDGASTKHRAAGKGRMGGWWVGVDIEGVCSGRHSASSLSANSRNAG